MFLVFWHLPPAAKHKPKEDAPLIAGWGKLRIFVITIASLCKDPGQGLCLLEGIEEISYSHSQRMESITSTLHTWFWKRYCSVLHPNYFIVFMELTSKEVCFHCLHVSWTRSGKWPKKSHKLLLSTLGFAVPAVRRWEHHKLLYSVGCWAVTQWLKYDTSIPVPRQSSQWSRWTA